MNQRKYGLSSPLQESGRLMKLYPKLFLFCSLCCLYDITCASAVIITTGNETYAIGNNLEVLEDTVGAFSIEDVIASSSFTPTTQQVPNLQISHSTFWVKFSVTNELTDEYFLLKLAYPIIDKVQLYIPQENGFIAENAGEEVPISRRKYQHQDFIFDLHIPQGETRTYYMKIKSGEQIMLPLTIGTPKQIFQTNTSFDLYNGIYFGMVLVMLLYNLFVFFSVRDKSYLFYVLYILFVGLTQASDGGYTYRMFWPNSPALANFMVTLFPSLVGTAAIFFMRYFLHTPKYIPKADKFFFILTGIYVLCVCLFATGHHQIGYQLTQVNALIVSVYMLVMACRIVQKGYRPAKFFLAAWTVFLLSVCLFVMKDLGVLPYNYLTKHVLQFGSAIELILLSFALADRINILKQEKELSQAKTVEALRENERIVREQNILLEGKVQERTFELQKSNSDLNTALTDLKEAQAQLVDSEKMASLGQLTAGIAHEINNPINFVVSNINPLKRDIQDLRAVLDKYEAIRDEKEFPQRVQEIQQFKEEIELNYVMDEINLLLKGIDEGATRTVEIVKSLRTFSRLDESDLKKADINDGLDSTLLLLNSSLNGKIHIVKNYAALQPVECYAGKLNQVFMNLLKNAIQAVEEKKYSGSDKPTVTVSTEDAGNEIIIRIRDNGTGMSEEVLKKIFEPFFTTKDVGKGTGLGLSIVYNIIEKHDGTIDVESVPGSGTQFTIALPKHQAKQDITHADKIRAMKTERRSRLVKNLKPSNNGSHELT